MPPPENFECKSSKIGNRMSNDTMYLMDNLSVNSHLYQLITQHVRASQAHGMDLTNRSFF